MTAEARMPGTGCERRGAPRANAGVPGVWSMSRRGQREVCAPACVAVALGVGVRVGVFVGVKLNVGVYVGVEVKVGVAVGVKLDVGVGVQVNVGVGE